MISNDMEKDMNLELRDDLFPKKDVTTIEPGYIFFLLDIKTILLRS